MITVIIITSLSGGIMATIADGDYTMYWKPVEQAMGKNGTLLEGGVFKIELLRDTPQVTLDGTRLKPAMALDSWVAFKRMGNGAMMMGDIVLTSDEMGPVQRKFTEEGIDITAVHNTLIGESPQVYDLHIGGYGDPVTMATRVRSTLDKVGISYLEEMTSLISTGQAEQLDRIMGYQGRAENSIYVYEVPRAEKITENGMEIPPTMDVSTMLKFQPLDDGRAAVTGDFILRPDEVKPVMKVLNENGIMVTALHTHMLREEPRLFMMHFWATGDASALAKGLRQALDRTNSVRP
jgi:Domain of Unknown Function (DUF1259)